jgi:hypothetical protein
MTGPVSATACGQFCRRITPDLELLKTYGIQESDQLDARDPS